MANIIPVIKKFLDFHEHVKCSSKQTLNWYKITFKQILEVTVIDDVSDINEEIIQHYLYWGRTTRKWSINTIHCRLRSLRAFIRWAIKNKYTKNDPFLFIKLPRLPIQVKEVLSYNQIAVVLQSLKATGLNSFSKIRNYAVITTFLHTGLRCFELININQHDVNIEEGLLMVNRGKGNRDRVIALNDEIVKVLAKYKEERSKKNYYCDAFFTLSKEDKRISKSSIRRIIETIEGRLKINFGPHTLRRTFATLMLEGGCDIHALQKMMGHAKIETLINNYLNVSYSHLKSQANKHPLVSPF